MSALYLDHFGLAESPFSITPNPQFFFAGSGRGSLFQALRYAVQAEEGIVTVIGEVGSGKTLLCRMLLDDLPDGVDAIYLANPSFSRNEILDAIAHDLGVSPEAGPTRIDALNAELIRRHGAGRRVVLLIDEAHAMPRDSLEEVRLLSNLETSRHKLLNIVLFGQPELQALLDQANLRQLRERIVQRFELGPLPAGEVRDYLAFRLQMAGFRGSLPFSPAAVALISRASQGITRRINILADKALLSVFARNAQLAEASDVQRAAGDAGIRLGADPRWLRIGRAAAIGLAVLAAFAVGRWAGNGQSESPRSGAPLAGQPAAESGPEPVAAATPDVPVSSAAPADAAISRSADETPVTTVMATSLEQQPFPAEQRFRDWLRQPGNAYTLQIATLRGGNAATLHTEIQALARQLDDPLLMQQRSDGNALELVVFLGDFAHAGDATAAISQLPEKVRNNQPIVRSRRNLRLGDPTLQ